mmetsp:Transcript_32178/g.102974  ORF Transcript_32178/g.102974 Transcript_32178/m.102974 type:complete len:86 (+) Transcript_32178:124-381(+)
MSAFAAADEQIAHLRIERVLAIQAEHPAHDSPLTSHEAPPLVARLSPRRIHCDRPFRFCVQAECMADDLEVGEHMSTWSDKQLVT